MKTIRICINSAGRAGDVKTLKQLPPSWKKFVTIAVPHDQYKAYKSKTDWNVERIHSSVPKFVSSQRQYMIEKCKEDYFCIMDDDLSFMTRNSDMKLKKSNHKQMNQMLKCMMQNLKEFPIVGISTRLGNNRVEEDYADITRTTRFFAMDRKVFKKVGATMAPFEPFCMYDFHIVLSFLEKGYPNRVIYKYAQGDIGGSNAKGGCSVYRTQALLEKVSNWLAKKHPGCVTVKRKRTKGSWQGFEKDADGYITRTDVICHWKKAYKPKRSKTSGLNKFM